MPYAMFFQEMCVIYAFAGLSPH